MKKKGVDGKITVKWIACMIVGRGLDSSGLGQGQMLGYCEILNKHLGCMKCEYFL
jgi:hypothetical protein